MPPRRYQSICGVAAFLLFVFCSSPRLLSPTGERSTLENESPSKPVSVDVRRRIEETSLATREHTPGFTLFDRLYLRNKTLFIVTRSPESFPPLSHVISQPKDRKIGHDIDPTAQEMQIITPEEARRVLGEETIVLKGLTFVFWDTRQYMAHYYHWWGELILGAMRVYSTVSLSNTLPIPEPNRILLPNVDDDSWRDRAGVNGPLTRVAWPNTPVERGDFWDDTAALNQTFVLDLAMIVCRSAAHKAPIVSHLAKMIAGTMSLPVPSNFWESTRRRIVRGTVGYVPLLDNAGQVLSPPKSDRPIVTYISRQKGQRSFTPEAHDSLVASLEQVAKDGLCRFEVVQMETLSLPKQIEVAARTTIMVGIHGNGLTHQLWMPSSPKSAIVEIFLPKRYLHDYEVLARSMGHKHYAIWNDTVLTYPEGEWYDGVAGGDAKEFNGFHTLPVDGPTVAKVVRDRLKGY